MLIAVDATELIIVSATLRGCAIEAADIGSQLLACASCPMPAEIQSVVDGFVRETDRALDSMAGELTSYSVDLTNRAQIAMTDSLAAATTAFEATPAVNTAISSASGLGTSIIVGSGLTEPIIFGSAPAAAGVPNLTVTSIGGGQMGDFGLGGVGYSAGAGATGMSTTGGPGGLGGYVNPGGIGTLIAAPGPGEGAGVLGFPTAETMAAGSGVTSIGTGLPAGAFVTPHASSGDPMRVAMDVAGRTVNPFPITTVPQGYGS